MKYKKELEDCKIYLDSLWYSIAFISLYGSQNYWMETEQSDFDFKAVHIPSLEELAENSKPVSTTIEYNWWQIDLKDIRIFIENIWKMNPVYIETLFTEYSISRYNRWKK